jgi:hypothetical protein
MKKTIVWLLGALLLFILGLGSYNLYQRLEIIESIEKITLEGEARRNPLLAARIFLNRMGVVASTKQSLQGLNNLPSLQSVLLISSRRSTLSQQAINDLYAWVREGGHLITRINQDDVEIYDNNDSDAKEMGKDSSDPLQTLMRVTTDEQLRVDKRPFSLTLKGAEQPLTLSIHYFYPIIPYDDVFLRNDETIHIKNAVFILRRHLDKGMITLVSDLGFINNRRIREADHAEIFWQLVHGLATPNEVWLIHNDEIPALWRLMWKQGWALIVTLTLMFVLWLYAAGHRFGPIIPKASEDRRSLLEHITASGHFYWQHRQKAKLIASSREALQQRLAVVHPSWQQLSDAEKIEQLAIRLERSQQDIQQLLFDPNYAIKKYQSDEFTQLIKQLEHIRKES